MSKAAKKKKQAASGSGNPFLKAGSPAERLFDAGKARLSKLEQKRKRAGDPSLMQRVAGFGSAIGRRANCALDGTPRDVEDEEAWLAWYDKWTKKGEQDQGLIERIMSCHGIEKDEARSILRRVKRWANVRGSEQRQPTRFRAPRETAPSRGRRTREDDDERPGDRESGEHERVSAHHGHGPQRSARSAFGALGEAPPGSAIGNFDAKFRLEGHAEAAVKQLDREISRLQLRRASIREALENIDVDALVQLGVISIPQSRDLARGLRR